MSDVVIVAAGGDTSYALTTDGDVYAWGENDQGQVGNGTTTDSHVPVLVQSLPPAVDISAGALPDGPTHVLAATSDGHAYTWGALGPHPADPSQAHDAQTTNRGNGNGQGNGNGGNGNTGSNGKGGSACKTDNGVGNGGVPGGGHDNGRAGGCPSSTGGNGNRSHGAVLLPTLVDGVDGVVQVAAGGASSYALTTTGAVFAWGSNHYGQLGLGPDLPQTVDQPTQIRGLPTIKMLAAGGAHALALSTRGQVFGWGDDNTGQISQPGHTCVSDDEDTPKICPSPQLIDGVTASAVAGGSVHSLIATVYEKVDGFGRDAEGELGDGYTHPATQVGPAGDRNGLDTPDGGLGGAQHDLVEVTGLGQIRPQAPVTAAYTYNGDGLRASSVTTVDDTTTVVPTTTSQTFTWDMLAGIPTLLSDGTHDYISGPDGVVVEQTDVLGQPSSGGPVYLHSDRLGSARLLTNTTGQPVGSPTYTPTGKRIQDDGPTILPYAQGIPPLQASTPFGFAGAYTDTGTGFAYLLARYEDPATDQFLTIDPALSQTLQPYSYALDDPVNTVDPSGLAAQSLGGADCPAPQPGSVDRASATGVFIYAVVGKNGRVKYVGQSVKPSRRLYSHVKRPMRIYDPSTGRQEPTVEMTYDRANGDDQIILNEKPLTPTEARGAEQGVLDYFGGKNATGNATNVIDPKNAEAFEQGRTDYSRALSLDPDFASRVEELKVNSVVEEQLGMSIEQLEETDPETAEIYADDAATGLEYEAGFGGGGSVGEEEEE